MTTQNNQTESELNHERTIENSLSSYSSNPVDLEDNSQLSLEPNFRLEVLHQETYSRSSAVLKALFGYFYILVPHYFVIFFFAIWSMVLNFVGFLYIMFTDKYPRNFFDYQVGLYRWILRVDTAYLGLYDSYPPFGINERTSEVTFEVKYPEEWRKDQVALIFFLGIFMTLPHLLIMLVLGIAASILSWVAWFSIIFTKKFPKDWHEFIVNYYRWYYRTGLYLGFLYPTYPPFNGKREEDQPQKEDFY